MIHKDLGDAYSTEVDAVGLYSAAGRMAERRWAHERTNFPLPESAARRQLANPGDVAQVLRPWMKRTRLGKANPVVTWSTDGNGMRAHASASGN